MDPALYTREGSTAGVPVQLLLVPGCTQEHQVPPSLASTLELPAQHHPPTPWPAQHTPSGVPAPPTQVWAGSVPPPGLLAWDLQPWTWLLLTHLLLSAETRSTLQTNQSSSTSRTPPPHQYILVASAGRRFTRMTRPSSASLAATSGSTDPALVWRRWLSTT